MEYRHFEPKHIKNTLYCCYSLLFWAINLILFEALGSQSKAHGSLILVAFVSFGILRLTNKKKDKDGILIITPKKENEDEQIE